MPTQRDRILDATLGLMARGGAHGTSMRAVAAACGLNVATLYHYFPSKHDLLQAAIAHRRAADLPASPFPEGPRGRRRGSPRRVARPLLRRHDRRRGPLARADRRRDPRRRRRPPAAARDGERVRARARRTGCATLCPDAPALHDPAVVRAIRNAVIGVLVEHLPQSEGRRGRALEARARELAHVVRADCPDKPAHHRPIETRRCHAPVRPARWRSHDRPGGAVRTRRARPDAVRARRRARRVPLDARERSGAPRREERHLGRLEVRRRLLRRASTRPVLQRAGCAARRAAAPTRCRSCRWTTPSTRASAG